MKIITVDPTDKVQRFQIAEKILRLYEAGEVSTRRTFELLERLYCPDLAEQKWNWPEVYATTEIDK